MEHWYNGHYLGMHIFWLITFIILLIWIFATPYNIPGQKTKKDTPLDILEKRFVNGEISKEEFEEKKQILEKK